MDGIPKADTKTKINVHCAVKLVSTVVTPFPLHADNNSNRSKPSIYRWASISTLIWGQQQYHPDLVDKLRTKMPRIAPFSLLWLRSISLLTTHFSDHNFILLSFLLFVFHLIVLLFFRWQRNPFRGRISMCASNYSSSSCRTIIYLWSVSRFVVLFFTGTVFLFN